MTDRSRLLEFHRGERDEDGGPWPYLVWPAGRGWRMAASTVLGGGIGEVRWVLNARVPLAYARTDPDAHLREIASAAGLSGPGAGMLTAANLDRVEYADDGSVEAAATVGLRVPTWAAAPDGAGAPPPREPAGTPAAAVPCRAGTINIVVAVPAALTDAALVNAVMTVTEAKTQALLDAGFACSGTASDAVCVAVRAEGPAEPFAGPRSRWGARLARAVHRCVHAGATRWAGEHAAPTP